MRRLRSGRAIAFAIAVLSGFLTVSPSPAVAAFGTATAASGSVTTATLAAPTNLSATRLVAVILSWTATTSSVASGTRVFRGTSHGGPYTQITQISGLATTSYTDVPGLGTFYYVVVAYYSGNGANWTSPHGNEASA